MLVVTVAYLLHPGTHLERASSVPDTTPVQTGTSLEWDPPVLDHPTTLFPPVHDTSPNGITDYTLDNSKDYVIKLPDQKKVGGLVIEGGRNVQIIGGYITANPDHSVDNTDWTSRALYIKKNVGTVHIEGVLIDDSAGGQSDGIEINSPDSIVQIENVRIAGLSGREDQYHADALVLDKNVKELRVDRFTAYSNYQGISFFGNGPSVMRNVNVGYKASPYVFDNGCCHFLWFTDNDCETATHNLSKVYVQPKSTQLLGNSVWPTVDDPASCKAVTSREETAASEKEKAVTWPQLPLIHGLAELGPPGGGDFVPDGVAGVSYVSPHRSS
jgi:hypothetical protein